MVDRENREGQRDPRLLRSGEVGGKMAEQETRTRVGNVRGGGHGGIS